MSNEILVLESPCSRLDHHYICVITPTKEPLMPRMVTLSVISSTETSCRLQAKGFMGVTEMDFPLSVAAVARGIELWDNGAMVQNAFSMLDADHREFLMTGMLPEQFNEVCGDD